MCGPFRGRETISLVVVVMCVKTKTTINGQTFMCVTKINIGRVRGRDDKRSNAQTAGDRQRREFATTVTNSITINTSSLRSSTYFVTPLPLAERLHKYSVCKKESKS